MGLGEYGEMLSTDKDGAWHRSAVVNGLDTAAVHLVDVGNPNNGFGHYLLGVNPALERVTGVDHRVDPAVLVGERLDFAHQDDETRIPLADVRTPIIRRPRPLPGRRRADRYYTLNCEEPSIPSCHFVRVHRR